METADLLALRKQHLEMMEAQLEMTRKPEDRMFAKHPDEDRIVLSHALFFVMSKPLIGKPEELKGLWLLRRYEEQMLTAYLTESEEYPELLRYCNVLYETFPFELSVARRGRVSPGRIKKIMATAIVAAGFGGDMDDTLANSLLDDMDFDDNGKLLLRHIEDLRPLLTTLVTAEMAYL